MTKEKSRDKIKWIVLSAVITSLVGWIVYSVMFTGTNIDLEAKGPDGADVQATIEVRGIARDAAGNVISDQKLSMWNLMALKWVADPGGPTSPAITSYQIVATATIAWSGWAPEIADAYLDWGTQYTAHSDDLGQDSAWLAWDAWNSNDQVTAMEGTGSGSTTKTFTGGANNLDTKFDAAFTGEYPMDYDTMDLRIGGAIFAQNTFGSARDPSAGYKYKTGAGEASNILVDFERVYYGQGSVSMSWSIDVWDTLKAKIGRCLEDFAGFWTFEWLYEGVGS